MSDSIGDFKLSASLPGHEDDVKAVSFIYPNVLASASRDSTVRVWKQVSEPVGKWEDTIVRHGSRYMSSLAFLPPGKDKDVQGLIVSGSQDSIIEVSDASKTTDQNPEAVLLGHAGNVCALDTSPSGNYIVSGSWDSTALVWTVGKWDSPLELKGHEGSVWGVLAFDDETVITACSDQFIRVFHVSGKLLRKWNGGGDILRALCRVPENHPSGASFASAGNDSIIRLWKLDDHYNEKLAGELVGHDNFIYSLTPLPTGELASSGEDRTVKIWKGTECIQTITHPAVSVWSVSANPDSADIVTGASDNIVRVFSRSIDRIAQPEVVKAFEDAVKASVIPSQVAPKVNQSELPGPDFLTSKSGTKDGQIQMIKETDGSITVHQWSLGQQQWIKIGTQMDAPSKPTLNGNEYDFVWDVDIEDGKPPIKLPYNLSENPWDAATKFLADNKLPVTYLEAVARWIMDRTPKQDRPADRPSTTTSTAAPSSTGSGVQLPHKEYLSIDAIRIDMVERKIKTMNQALVDAGDSAALSRAELDQIEAIDRLIQLDKREFGDKPAGLDVAIKIATTWEYPQKRMAGLDILRVLAVSSTAANFKGPNGESFIDVLLTSVNAASPPDENNAMLAIRAFGNLFQSEQGRKLVLEQREKILHLCAGPVENKSQNRNLMIAISTLALNFSVFLASEDGCKPDEKTTFDIGTTLLELLARLLSEQKDAEVLYRGLVATGTLLASGEEFISAAKEVYGIDAAVKMAMKCVDARIKKVGREVVELLNN